MALCVAEHLANGTLTETNLQLGAAIANGGLDGAPVVEGIVTAAIQKIEFQQRQCREEPSMGGRHRALSKIQMSRLQDAVSALRFTNKKELIKSLGLGTTAFKPVGEAADVFPFCSLDDPDKLQNNQTNFGKPASQKRTAAANNSGAFKAGAAAGAAAEAISKRRKLRTAEDGHRPSEEASSSGRAGAQRSPPKCGQCKSTYTSKVVATGPNKGQQMWMGDNHLCNKCYQMNDDIIRNHLCNIVKNLD